MTDSSDRAATIEVELGGPLATLLLERKRELQRRLVDDVSRELAELGLPPRVGAVVGSGNHSMLRVRCRGVELRYPTDLLSQTWLAFARTLDVGASDAPASFAELLRQELDGDGDRALEYAATTIREIVRRQPSALLPREPATGAPAAHATQDPLDPVGLIAFLLDLGVRSPYSGRLMDLLDMGRQLDQPAEAVAEVAYDEMRMKVVQLTVDHDYLREILPQDSKSDQGAASRQGMSSVAQEIFNHLGVWIPRVEIVTPEGWPPAVIALKVNDTTEPLIPLIQAGEELRLDAMESIAGIARARRAISPLDGSRCTIASQRKHSQERQDVFSPFELLVAVVRTRLSRRPDRFMSISHVEASLRQLDLFQPELAAAARRRLPLWKVARLSRELLAERISVHDSRDLLERLLELEDAPAFEPLRRSRLKALTAPASREDQRLRVLRPLRALEETAVASTRSRTGASDDFELQVCEAFSLAARTGPADAILTRPAARTAIREILAPELLDLPVMSTSDMAVGAGFDAYDVGLPPTAASGRPTPAQAR